MNELLENLISLTKKTTKLVLEQLAVITEKVNAELNKPSTTATQEAAPVAAAPKTEPAKEEPAKTVAPEAPKPAAVEPVIVAEKPKPAPKKEAAPVKPAAAAKAKAVDFPEDSVLKRHAAQLKASATQTVTIKSAAAAPAKSAASEVPTDSILRRHYETLHKK